MLIVEDEVEEDMMVLMISRFVLELCLAREIILMC